VALDRLLAASARNLRRTLAELREERLHSLAALREDVGFVLDMRREDAHTVSVAAGEVVPRANSENSTNRTKSPRVSNGEKMRIQVDPAAREGLLEFLRRADCDAQPEGESTVIVEVPDALGDEQARLEVDLYIKAWQASHPDVDAHLLSSS
jgi:hypothetical protein